MISEVAVEAIKVTAEYAKETVKEVAKKAKDVSVDITKRIETSTKSVTSRPDKIDITKRIPEARSIRDIEDIKSLKNEKNLAINTLDKIDRDKLSIADEKKHLDMDRSDHEFAKKNLDHSHKDCLTSSAERKELANRGKGEWDGESGNSRFHPEKIEAREALTKYKQEGIDYKDGEPDFSKVSEATVKIEDMTSIRPYNFRQANEVCAKQWNEEKKDGRTDWTARKVEDWRIENKYSWHERLDMKTMDLVQRDIHDECKHYGGIAECRRYEALTGGGFDD